MSKWPGLFLCKCDSQQACHQNSICNAKQLCVECIAKECFEDRPNIEFDWKDPISDVLVYYLTTGKIGRGTT